MSAVGSIRSTAMTPMPPKAINAPTTCSQPGRSPSSQTAMMTVKKACTWMTIEERPAGMPSLSPV